ncbi:MAG: hypothetical protein AAFX99_13255, partial [Myxococcota bacterium]
QRISQRQRHRRGPLRWSQQSYNIFGGLRVPPEGSFTPIGPGDTHLPKAGDVLALAKPNGKKFAHVSFFKTVLPGEEGEDLWVTNDGGRENADQRRTHYEPATNKLWEKKPSERKAHTQPRYVVKGWLDIEILFQAEQDKAAAFIDQYTQILDTKKPGQGLGSREHEELRKAHGLTRALYPKYIKALGLPTVRASS